MDREIVGWIVLILVTALARMTVVEAVLNARKDCHGRPINDETRFDHEYKDEETESSASVSSGIHNMLNATTGRTYGPLYGAGNTTLSNAVAALSHVECRVDTDCPGSTKCREPNTDSAVEWLSCNDRCNHTAGYVCGQSKKTGCGWGANQADRKALSGIIIESPTGATMDAAKARTACAAHPLCTGIQCRKDSAAAGGPFFYHDNVNHVDATVFLQSTFPDSAFPATKIDDIPFVYQMHAGTKYSHYLDGSKDGKFYDTQLEAERVCRTNPNCVGVQSKHRLNKGHCPDKVHMEKTPMGERWNVWDCPARNCLNKDGIQCLRPTGMTGETSPSYVKPKAVFTIHTGILRKRVEYRGNPPVEYPLPDHSTSPQVWLKPPGFPLFSPWPFGTCRLAIQSSPGPIDKNSYFAPGFLFQPYSCPNKHYRFDNLLPIYGTDCPSKEDILAFPTSVSGYNARWSRWYCPGGNTCGCLRPAGTTGADSPAYVRSLNTPSAWHTDLHRRFVSRQGKDGVVCPTAEMLLKYYSPQEGHGPRWTDWDCAGCNCGCNRPEGLTAAQSPACVKAISSTTTEQIGMEVLSKALDGQHAALDPAKEKCRARCLQNQACVAYYMRSFQPLTLSNFGVGCVLLKENPNHAHYVADMQCVKQNTLDGVGEILPRRLTKTFTINFKVPEGTAVPAGSPGDQMVTHGWNDKMQCDNLENVRVRIPSYWKLNSKRLSVEASGTTLLEAKQKCNAIAECNFVQKLSSFELWNLSPVPRPIIGYENPRVTCYHTDANNTFAMNNLWNAGMRSNTTLNGAETNYPSPSKLAESSFYNDIRDTAYLSGVVGAIRFDRILSFKYEIGWTHDPFGLCNNHPISDTEKSYRRKFIKISSTAVTKPAIPLVTNFKIYDGDISPAITLCEKTPGCNYVKLLRDQSKQDTMCELHAMTAVPGYKTVSYWCDTSSGAITLRDQTKSSPTASDPERTVPDSYEYAIILLDRAKWIALKEMPSNQIRYKSYAPQQDIIGTAAPTLPVRDHRTTVIKYCTAVADNAKCTRHSDCQLNDYSRPGYNENVAAADALKGDAKGLTSQDDATHPSSKCNDPRKPVNGLKKDKGQRQDGYPWSGAGSRYDGNTGKGRSSGTQCGSPQTSPVECAMKRLQEFNFFGRTLALRHFVPLGKAQLCVDNANICNTGTWQRRVNFDTKQLFNEKYESYGGGVHSRFNAMCLNHMCEDRDRNTCCWKKENDADLNKCKTYGCSHGYMLNEAALTLACPDEENGRCRKFPAGISVDQDNNHKQCCTKIVYDEATYNKLAAKGPSELKRYFGNHWHERVFRFRVDGPDDWDTLMQLLGFVNTMDTKISASESTYGHYCRLDRHNPNKLLRTGVSCTNKDTGDAAVIHTLKTVSHTNDVVGVSHNNDGRIPHTVHYQYQHYNMNEANLRYGADAIYDVNQEMQLAGRGLRYAWEAILHNTRMACRGAGIAGRLINGGINAPQTNRPPREVDWNEHKTVRNDESKKNPSINTRQNQHSHGLHQRLDTGKAYWEDPEKRYVQQTDPTKSYNKEVKSNDAAKNGYGRCTQKWFLEGSIPYSAENAKQAGEMAQDFWTAPQAYGDPTWRYGHDPNYRGKVDYDVGRTTATVYTAPMFASVAEEFSEEQYTEYSEDGQTAKPASSEVKQALEKDEGYELLTGHNNNFMLFTKHKYRFFTARRLSVNGNHDNWETHAVNLDNGVTYPTSAQLDAPSNIAKLTKPHKAGMICRYDYKALKYTDSCVTPMVFVSMLLGGRTGNAFCDKKHGGGENYLYMGCFERANHAADFSFVPLGDPFVASDDYKNNLHKYRTMCADRVFDMCPSKHDIENTPMSERWAKWDCPGNTCGCQRPAGLTGAECPTYVQKVTTLDKKYMRCPSKEDIEATPPEVRWAKWDCPGNTCGCQRPAGLGDSECPAHVRKRIHANTIQDGDRVYFSLSKYKESSTKNLVQCEVVVVTQPNSVNRAPLTTPQLMNDIKKTDDTTLHNLLSHESQLKRSENCVGKCSTTLADTKQKHRCVFLATAYTSRTKTETGKVRDSSTFDSGAQMYSHHPEKQDHSDVPGMMNAYRDNKTPAKFRTIQNAGLSACVNIRDLLVGVQQHVKENTMCPTEFQLRKSLTAATKTNRWRCPSGGGSCCSHSDVQSMERAGNIVNFNGFPNPVRKSNPLQLFSTKPLDGTQHGYDMSHAAAVQANAAGETAFGCPGLSKRRCSPCSIIYNLGNGPLSMRSFASNDKSYLTQTIPMPRVDNVEDYGVEITNSRMSGSKLTLQPSTHNANANLYCPDDVLKNNNFEFVSRSLPGGNFSGYCEGKSVTGSVTTPRTLTLTDCLKVDNTKVGVTVKLFNCDDEIDFDPYTGGLITRYALPGGAWLKDASVHSQRWCTFNANSLALCATRLDGQGTAWNGDILSKPFGTLWKIRFTVEPTYQTRTYYLEQDTAASEPVAPYAPAVSVRMRTKTGVVTNETAFTYLTHTDVPTTVMPVLTTLVNAPMMAHKAHFKGIDTKPLVVDSKIWGSCNRASMYRYMRSYTEPDNSGKMSAHIPVNYTHKCKCYVNRPGEYNVQHVLNPDKESNYRKFSFSKLLAVTSCSQTCQSQGYTKFYLKIGYAEWEHNTQRKDPIHKITGCFCLDAIRTGSGEYPIGNPDTMDLHINAAMQNAHLYQYLGGTGYKLRAFKVFVIGADKTKYYLIRDRTSQVLSHYKNGDSLVTNLYKFEKNVNSKTDDHLWYFVNPHTEVTQGMDNHLWSGLKGTITADMGSVGLALQSTTRLYENRMFSQRADVQCVYTSDFMTKTFLGNATVISTNSVDDDSVLVRCSRHCKTSAQFAVQTKDVSPELGLNHNCYCLSHFRDVHLSLMPHPYPKTNFGTYEPAVTWNRNQHIKTAVINMHRVFVYGHLSSHSTKWHMWGSGFTVSSTDVNVRVQGSTNCYLRSGFPWHFCECPNQNSPCVNPPLINFDWGSKITIVVTGDGVMLSGNEAMCFTKDSPSGEVPGLGCMSALSTIKSTVNDFVSYQNQFTYMRGHDNNSYYTNYQYQLRFWPPVNCGSARNIQPSVYSCPTGKIAMPNETSCDSDLLKDGCRSLAKYQQTCCREPITCMTNKADGYATGSTDNATAAVYENEPLMTDKVWYSPPDRQCVKVDPTPYSYAYWSRYPNGELTAPISGQYGQTLEAAQTACRNHNQCLGVDCSGTGLSSCLMHTNSTVIPSSSGRISYVLRYNSTSRWDNAYNDVYNPVHLFSENVNVEPPPSQRTQVTEVYRGSMGRCAVACNAYKYFGLQGFTDTSQLWARCRCANDLQTAQVVPLRFCAQNKLRHTHYPVGNVSYIAVYLVDSDKSLNNKILFPISATDMRGVTTSATDAYTVRMPYDAAWGEGRAGYTQKATYVEEETQYSTEPLIWANKKFQHPRKASCVVFAGQYFNEWKYQTVYDNDVHALAKCATRCSRMHSNNHLAMTRFGLSCPKKTNTGAETVDCYCRETSLYYANYAQAKHPFACRGGEYRANNGGCNGTAIQSGYSMGGFQRMAVYLTFNAPSRQHGFYQPREFQCVKKSQWEGRPFTTYPWKSEQTDNTPVDKHTMSHCARSCRGYPYFALSCPKLNSGNNNQWQVGCWCARDIDSRYARPNEECRTNKHYFSEWSVVSPTISINENGDTRPQYHCNGRQWMNTDGGVHNMDGSPIDDEDSLSTRPSYSLGSIDRYAVYLNNDYHYEDSIMGWRNVSYATQGPAAGVDLGSGKEGTAKMGNGFSIHAAIPTGISNPQINNYNSGKYNIEWSSLCNARGTGRTYCNPFRRFYMCTVDKVKRLCLFNKYGDPLDNQYPFQNYGTAYATQKNSHGTEAQNMEENYKFFVEDGFKEREINFPAWSPVWGRDLTSGYPCKQDLLVCPTKVEHNTDPSAKPQYLVPQQQEPSTLFGNQLTVGNSDKFCLTDYDRYAADKWGPWVTNNQNQQDNFTRFQTIETITQSGSLAACKELCNKKVGDSNCPSGATCSTFAQYANATCVAVRYDGLSGDCELLWMDPTDTRSNEVPLLQKGIESYDQDRIVKNLKRPTTVILESRLTYPVFFNLRYGDTTNEFKLALTPAMRATANHLNFLQFTQSDRSNPMLPVGWISCYMFCAGLDPMRDVCKHTYTSGQMIVLATYGKNHADCYASCMSNTQCQGVQASGQTHVANSCILFKLSRQVKAGRLDEIRINLGCDARLRRHMYPASTMYLARRLDTMNTVIAPGWVDISDITKAGSAKWTVANWYLNTGTADSSSFKIFARHPYLNGAFSPVGGTNQLNKIPMFGEAAGLEVAAPSFSWISPHGSGFNDATACRKCPSDSFSRYGTQFLGCFSGTLYGPLYKIQRWSASEQVVYLRPTRLRMAPLQDINYGSSTPYAMQCYTECRGYYGVSTLNVFFAIHSTGYCMCSKHLRHFTKWGSPSTASGLHEEQCNCNSGNVGDHSLCVYTVEPVCSPGTYECKTFTTFITPPKVNNKAVSVLNTNDPSKIMNYWKQYDVVNMEFRVTGIGTLMDCHKDPGATKLAPCGVNDGVGVFKVTQKCTATQPTCCTQLLPCSFSADQTLSEAKTVTMWKNTSAITQPYDASLALQAPLLYTEHAAFAECSSNSDCDFVNFGRYSTNQPNHVRGVGGCTEVMQKHFRAAYCPQDPNGAKTHCTYCNLAAVEKVKVIESKPLVLGRVSNTAAGVNATMRKFGLRVSFYKSDSSVSLTNPYWLPASSREYRMMANSKKNSWLMPESMTFDVWDCGPWQNYTLFKGFSCTLRIEIRALHRFGKEWYFRSREADVHGMTSTAEVNKTVEQRMPLIWVSEICQQCAATHYLSVDGSRCIKKGPLRCSPLMTATSVDSYYGNVACREKLLTVTSGVLPLVSQVDLIKLASSARRVIDPVVYRDMNFFSAQQNWLGVAIQTQAGKVVATYEEPDFTVRNRHDFLCAAGTFSNDGTAPFVNTLCRTDADCKPPPLLSASASNNDRILYDNKWASMTGYKRADFEYYANTVYGGYSQYNSGIKCATWKGTRVAPTEGSWFECISCGQANNRGGTYSAATTNKAATTFVNSGAAPASDPVDACYWKFGPRTSGSSAIREEPMTSVVALQTAGPNGIPTYVLNGVSVQSGLYGGYETVLSHCKLVCGLMPVSECPAVVMKYAANIKKEVCYVMKLQLLGVMPHWATYGCSRTFSSDCTSSTCLIGAVRHVQGLEIRAVSNTTEGYIMPSGSRCHLTSQYRVYWSFFDNVGRQIRGDLQTYNNQLLCDQECGKSELCDGYTWTELHSSQAAGECRFLDKIKHAKRGSVGVYECTSDLGVYNLAELTTPLGGTNNKSCVPGPNQNRSNFALPTAPCELCTASPVVRDGTSVVVIDDGVNVTNTSLVGATPLTMQIVFAPTQGVSMNTLCGAGTYRYMCDGHLRGPAFVQTNKLVRVNRDAGQTSVKAEQVCQFNSQHASLVNVNTGGVCAGHGSELPTQQYMNPASVPFVSNSELEMWSSCSKHCGGTASVACFIRTNNQTSGVLKRLNATHNNGLALTNMQACKNECEKHPKCVAVFLTSSNEVHELSCELYQYSSVKASYAAVEFLFACQPPDSTYASGLLFLPRLSTGSSLRYVDHAQAILVRNKPVAPSWSATCARLCAQPTTRLGQPYVHCYVNVDDLRLHSKVASTSYLNSFSESLARKQCEANNTANPNACHGVIAHANGTFDAILFTTTAYVPFGCTRDVSTPDAVTWLRSSEEVAEFTHRDRMPYSQAEYMGCFTKPDASKLTATTNATSMSVIEYGSHVQYVRQNWLQSGSNSSNVTGSTAIDALQIIQCPALCPGLSNFTCRFVNNSMRVKRRRFEPAGTSPVYVRFNLECTQFDTSELERRYVLPSDNQELVTHIKNRNTTLLIAPVKVSDAVAAVIWSTSTIIDTRPHHAFLKWRFVTGVDERSPDGLWCSWMCRLLHGMRVSVFDYMDFDSPCSCRADMGDVFNTFTLKNEDSISDDENVRKCTSTYGPSVAVHQSMDSAHHPVPTSIFLLNAVALDDTTHSLVKKNLMFSNDTVIKARKAELAKHTGITYYPSNDWTNCVQMCASESSDVYPVCHLQALDPTYWKVIRNDLRYSNDTQAMLACRLRSDCHGYVRKRYTNVGNNNTLYYVYELGQWHANVATGQHVARVRYACSTFASNEAVWKINPYTTSANSNVTITEFTGRFLIKRCPNEMTYTASNPRLTKSVWQVPLATAAMETQTKLPTFKVMNTSHLCASKFQVRVNATTVLDCASACALHPLCFTFSMTFNASVGCRIATSPTGCSALHQRNNSAVYSMTCGPEYDVCRMVELDYGTNQVASQLGTCQKNDTRAALGRVKHGTSMSLSGFSYTANEAVANASGVSIPSLTYKRTAVLWNGICTRTGTSHSVMPCWPCSPGTFQRKLGQGACEQGYARRTGNTVCNVTLMDCNSTGATYDKGYTWRSTDLLSYCIDPTMLQRGGVLKYAPYRFPNGTCMDHSQRVCPAGKVVDPRGGNSDGCIPCAAGTAKTRIVNGVTETYHTKLCPLASGNQSDSCGTGRYCRPMYENVNVTQESIGYCAPVDTAAGMPCFQCTAGMEYSFKASQTCLPQTLCSEGQYVSVPKSSMSVANYTQVHSSQPNTALCKPCPVGTWTPHGLKLPGVFECIPCRWDNALVKSRDDGAPPTVCCPRSQLYTSTSLANTSLPFRKVWQLSRRRRTFTECPETAGGVERMYPAGDGFISNRDSDFMFVNGVNSTGVTHNNSYDLSVSTLMAGKTGIGNVLQDECHRLCYVGVVASSLVTPDTYFTLSRPSLSVAQCRCYVNPQWNISIISGGTLAEYEHSKALCGGLELSSQFGSTRCIYKSSYATHSYTSCYACKPCTMGFGVSIMRTVSNQLLSTCLKCPMGTEWYLNGVIPDRSNPTLTYVPQVQVWKCRVCNVNEFSNHPGLLSCKPCPNGTVSPAGSSFCSSCPVGYRSTKDMIASDGTQSASCIVVDMNGVASTSTDAQQCNSINTAQSQKDKSESVDQMIISIIEIESAFWIASNFKYRLNMYLDKQLRNPNNDQTCDSRVCPAGYGILDYKMPWNTTQNVQPNYAGASCSQHADCGPYSIHAGTAPPGKGAHLIGFDSGCRTEAGDTVTRARDPYSLASFLGVADFVIETAELQSWPRMHCSNTTRTCQSCGCFRNSDCGNTHDTGPQSTFIPGGNTSASDHTCYAGSYTYCRKQSNQLLGQCQLCDFRTSNQNLFGADLNRTALLMNYSDLDQAYRTCKTEDANPCGASSTRGNNVSSCATDPGNYRLYCDAVNFGSGTSGQCRPCPRFMTRLVTARFQGWTDCSPCKIGFFNDGTDGKCTRCPCGWTSDLQSAYSTDSNSTTSTGGFQRCVKCNNYDEIIEQSNNCAPGTDPTQIVTCNSCKPTQRLRQNTCQACHTGTYRVTNKQSYTYTGGDAADCRACKSGYHVNPALILPYPQFLRNPAVCRPGSQTNIEAGYRYQCRVTKEVRAQSSVNLPTCLPCPIGTYSVGYETLTQSIAMEGEGPSYLACRPCPYGYTTKFPAATNWLDCSPCEQVNFELKPGAANCTRCAPGYSTFGLRGNPCTPCPPGTTTVQLEGAVEVVQNVTGGVSTQKSGSLSEHCEVCPGGTYVYKNAPGLGCLKCAPGRFSMPGTAYDSNHTNLDSTDFALHRLYNPPCTPCPAGKFAPLAGSASCEDCPAFTATGKCSTYEYAMYANRTQRRYKEKCQEMTVVLGTTNAIDVQLYKGFYRTGQSYCTEQCYNLPSFAKNDVFPDRMSCYTSGCEECVFMTDREIKKVATQVVCDEDSHKAHQFLQAAGTQVLLIMVIATLLRAMQLMYFEQYDDVEEGYEDKQLGIMDRLNPPRYDNYEKEELIKRRRESNSSEDSSDEEEERKKKKKNKQRNKNKKGAPAQKSKSSLSRTSKIKKSLAQLKKRAKGCVIC